MDIINTIAFLTLYYILWIGVVIAFKETGLEEVELEKSDYLMAVFFPLVVFLDSAEIMEVIQV